jgi:PAS domain S-box-containing protein
MAQKPNGKPHSEENACERQSDRNTGTTSREGQCLGIDEQDLPFFPVGANCLLWQSNIYETGEQYLRWETCLVNPESAQSFFPLHLKPDESYLGAWYRSRFPQDRDACDQVANTAVRAGSGFQQEFRCVGADGATRWFAEDVRVEVIEPGKRYRAVGVCTDLTARKQLEQALLESERRAHLIAEAMPQIVWTAYPDGAPNYINRRWMELTGQSFHQAEGIGWLEAVHPDDAAAALSTWRHALQMGQRCEIECRYLRSCDRTYRWHLARALPVRNEEGHITMWIGTCTDIHEMKQAQALVAMQNAVLERIAQHEPLSAILEAIALLTETHLCDAFVSLLLFDSATETLRYGTGPSLPAAFNAEIDGLAVRENNGACGRAAFYKAEVIVSDILMDTLCRDYRELTTLYAFRAIWSTPILTAKGELLGTFAIYYRAPHLPTTDEKQIVKVATYLSQMAIEVTEREKLEAQLRQAQKVEGIGRLAGGIAHDFNNLTQIILGYAELLEESLADDDKRFSSIRNIQTAANRAATLTRQLLTFARREAVIARVIAPFEVLIRITQMLRPLIGENVQLHLNIAEDCGYILIDPGQLEQVVINLVINARDAVSDQGMIALSAERVAFDTPASYHEILLRAGEYLLLSVSDTGSGMTEEVRRQIFEPFFTTKSPGQGTGLGLATVYGIVKSAGGQIYVESKEHVGTTFRIYLPLVEAPQLSNPAPEQSIAPSDGGETVLVVEDEPMVRDLSVQTLRRYGYTVLEAGNGEEALALSAAYSGPIDLLVTDLVMPVMGGKELAAKVSAVRSDIRIVFVTGYAEDALGGVLPPDTALLQKPFTAEVLLASVRKTLR